MAKLLTWKNAISTTRVEVGNPNIPPFYASPNSPSVGELAAVSAKELVDGWPQSAVTKANAIRSTPRLVWHTPNGISSLTSCPVELLPMGLDYVKLAKAATPSISAFANVGPARPSLVTQAKALLDVGIDQASSPDLEAVIDGGLANNFFSVNFSATATPSDAHVKQLLEELTGGQIDPTTVTRTKSTMAMTGSTAEYLFSAVEGAAASILEPVVTILVHYRDVYVGVVMWSFTLPIPAHLLGVYMLHYSGKLSYEMNTTNALHFYGEEALRLVTVVAEPCWQTWIAAENSDLIVTPWSTGQALTTALGYFNLIPASKKLAFRSSSFAAGGVRLIPPTGSAEISKLGTMELVHDSIYVIGMPDFVDTVTYIGSLRTDLPGGRTLDEAWGAFSWSGTALRTDGRDTATALTLQQRADLDAMKVVSVIHNAQVVAPARAVFEAGLPAMIQLREGDAQATTDFLASILVPASLDPVTPAITVDQGLTRIVGRNFTLHHKVASVDTLLAIDALVITKVGGTFIATPIVDGQRDHTFTEQDINWAFLMGCKVINGTPDTLEAALAAISPDYGVIGGFPDIDKIRAVYMSMNEGLAFGSRLPCLENLDEGSRLGVMLTTGLTKKDPLSSVIMTALMSAKAALRSLM